MGFFPKSWGFYPAEYNPEVHGYYYPHRYYGKPDTPLGEVKLGELGAWIGRRNKSLGAIGRAIHRTIWKHHVVWLSPKKPGVAPLFHYIVFITLISYATKYIDLRHEKKYRYH